MSITVKKVYEFDLYNDTWDGAKDRMESLTDDLRNQLEDLVESMFSDREDIPEETEVNDFIWFEDDTYADWLGFESADQMWKYCDIINNGTDEDDLYWDDNTNKFVTIADIESEFATYQAENDDWDEYYIDVEDYAEDQGYEKFEL